MQGLYQQYLASGPVSYVKDLFESMDIENADKKAVRFYAIMYFYYSAYDGAGDKKQIKEEFESAISSMVNEIKKQLHGNKLNYNSRIKGALYHEE